MTTSVWPSAAIASADAKGSIVRTTPLFRLEDANSQLTANSNAVATSTVAKPRDTNLLDPRGMVAFDSSELPLRDSRLTLAEDANVPRECSQVPGEHSHRVL